MNTLFNDDDDPIVDSANEPLQIVVKISKQAFSAKVEDLVWEHDIDYVEACAKACEELDVDPEDVASLISKELLLNIEASAKKKHLMRKPKQKSTSELPV